MCNSNSRKWNDFGNQNIDDIRNLASRGIQCLSKLHFPSGQLVIESRRKTGFL